ncbi:hypothetical protein [Streptomyces sp. 351MFTsu5.1]|uniref:hypothetical protein n=1 Tax=Streptomyces sp. 351MFTsu5.1 TaxID=1172180 RepID=UPI00131A2E25|nr:hypothetical protein [Streptomyces sp. 351MFTsu5.1]
MCRNGTLGVIGMAGMGPAPKPNARRRNATVAMTELPANGREGAPPAWPLLPDIALTTQRDSAQRTADELELSLAEPNLTGRQRSTAQRKADAAREAAAILTAQLTAQERVEAELWAALWALPQAVEWERAGWVREVAQYVRWKARAEQGDLDASKEARQLGDRLGLTPLALLRLRWKVAAHDEESVPRSRRRPSTGRRPDDPRAALHVVE